MPHGMSDAPPPPPPAHPALAEGVRLGQYEVRRTVGAGGMGVVYLARDLDLQRDVAIKVLGASTADGVQRERFLLEARAAARLNHPNIATVYQIGTHEGLSYLAMEWLEGGSLSERLREQIVLDWREATAAARDAAAGLDAAHRAGVIHRDVKPSNLMRTAAGTVKLVDFGLARLHDVPSELTQTGTIVGTPVYLSPEQCRGEPATALSDVYALTCTYFHLLTSRPPFASQNVPGLLYQHIHEAFPDARRFAAEVPAEICAILARGGRKAPIERFGSAGEMLAALEEVLREASPVVSVSKRSTLLTTMFDSSAAAAAPRVPHNLPPELTRFIGRGRETADARQALASSRLVTLLGPGGTGKTRLSLHVAAEVLGDFPDGVWFVDLAAIAEAQRIPPAVAAPLGVREVRGQPLMETIRQRIAGGRVLILLDNCEHLIGAAAAAVAELLLACPNLRVLATSRQSLGCVGELTLRVPPFDAPASGVVSTAALAELDAVRLFVDRAAQVRPGFALSDDNAEPIAQICRRLDGIPLAIELAAARVKVLAPRQIALRLADAFKLLTGGSRTLLPRQQTLRALIDWSYQLLTDDERAAFARLAAFVSGFDLEAAESVAGGDGVDPAAVLDLVASLVDKSLLIMDERSGGDARYRMLETIRQFAAERLDDATRVRHLEYCAALAERAAPELFGPQQARFLARLDAEHDNVLAALDFGGVRPAALRLAEAMTRYWFMRGQLVLGIARLDRIIAASAGAPPSSALAAVLNGAAKLATHHGEPDKARSYLQRALAMAQALGDRDVEASALNNLGTLAKETGDFARARELLERVLPLRRAGSDRVALAGALNNVGIVLKVQGEAESARGFLEESLAIRRQTGDPMWISYTSMNLAELELDQGDAAAARARFEAARTALEPLQDEWGLAYVAEGLGRCALMVGDLDAAQQHFERALTVVRRLDDGRAVADQLDQLAQVACRRGDDPGAVRLGQEALALRRRIRDRLGIAKSFETLAAAHAPSDPARAARLLGAAGSVRDAIGAPLAPAMRTHHEELVARVRQALGEDAYAAQLAAGKTSGAGTEA
jgi:non-specific serine/threonine protein kinase